VTYQGTTTGVLTKVPETAPLTTHDRCDRCGAQAYVSVTFVDENTLLFCGHHFAANERALHRVALVVRDERCRLHTSSNPMR